VEGKRERGGEKVAMFLSAIDRRLSIADGSYLEIKPMLPQVFSHCANQSHL
jgi:hypothetical protein